MNHLKIKDFQQIIDRIEPLEKQYDDKNLALEALGWLNTFHSWADDGDVLELLLHFNPEEDSTQVIGYENLTKGRGKSVSGPIDDRIVERLTREDQRFLFTVDKAHLQEALEQLLGDWLNLVEQWHPEMSLAEKLSNWQHLHNEVKSLHEDLCFKKLMKEAFLWLEEINSWGKDGEVFMLHVDYDWESRSNLVHYALRTDRGLRVAVDKSISDEVMNNLCTGAYYEVKVSTADPWSLLEKLMGNGFKHYQKLWLDQQMPENAIKGKVKKI